MPGVREERGKKGNSITCSSTRQTTNGMRGLYFTYVTRIIRRNKTYLRVKDELGRDTSTETALDGKTHSVTGCTNGNFSQ